MSLLRARLFPFIAPFIALAGALLSTGGCGPKPSPELVPTLPRDGNEHTAKPGAEGAPASPSSGSAAAGNSWANRKDLIAAPPAQPPRAVELPAIERFTLPNGLQVVVVKSSRVPVVSMELAVKAGDIDAPRGKMGLAQFAASMLSKGTRTRNAVTIASTIEGIGGALRAEAGLESTRVGCDAMAKHMRTCATLLSDIVVNATFPAAEMDEVRQNLLAALSQRQDNAGQLASAHFDHFLWGSEHGRGWPVSMASIGAISRADLQAWHRSWFLPNNAVLAVAGDIDPKALRAELTRAFALWRRGKAPERPSFQDPALQGMKIRLVNKPGQTQSHIRIGHLGISAAEPAFFDHLVYNYVLGGGGFSSRLMKVVRSEGGKSYGASSRLDRDRLRGAFQASTFTRSAETVATIKLILGQITAMKSGGPNADEVRDAITHLAGSYPIRLQAASDVAAALLDAELLGLGDEFVRTYPLEVGKVTAESAGRAAKSALNAQNVAIVIVGDAAAVEPQLKQAGWRYEVVSHMAPIADYEREAPAAAPGGADAEKAGQALIDKAIQAKGGLAKLQAVKTLSMVATGMIKAQGQEFPASFTRRFVAPDKLRMDLKITFGNMANEVITVLDGTSGFSQSPQGMVDLPPEAVAELKKQVWRDHEFVLLRAKEKGARAAALGDQTLEGTVYSAVQITHADGQSMITLYLDKKTHLIAAMTYTEQGSQAMELFTQYKAVNGIQVAHQREMRSPEAILKINVTKVAFNEAIDPAVFAKPK